jgi:hypothetical protein
MKRLLLLAERAELWLCVVVMNKRIAFPHADRFHASFIPVFPVFAGTGVRWMKRMNQVVRYKEFGEKSANGKRRCRVHIVLGAWLVRRCRVGFLFEAKSG